MPNTYPTSLTILEGSEITPVDGFIPVRATNGTLKVRQTMPAEKNDFTLLHLLTKADWSTLLTFYNNNKNADVYLYWPGDTSPYTVRFVGVPKRSGSPWHMYSVTVKLGEV